MRKKIKNVSLLLDRGIGFIARESFQTAWTEGGSWMGTLLLDHFLPPITNFSGDCLKISLCINFQLDCVTFRFWWGGAWAWSWLSDFFIVKFEFPVPKLVSVPIFSLIG